MRCIIDVCRSRKRVGRWSEWYNGAKQLKPSEGTCRAFTNSDKIDAYIASASGSKTDFLKAVLNERKWEFAGENMRWKDWFVIIYMEKYSIIASYDTTQWLKTQQELLTILKR
jgi:hypothetical protein